MSSRYSLATLAVLAILTASAMPGRVSADPAPELTLKTAGDREWPEGVEANLRTLIDLSRYPCRPGPGQLQADPVPKAEPQPPSRARLPCCTPHAPSGAPLLPCSRPSPSPPWAPAGGTAGAHTYIVFGGLRAAKVRNPLSPL